MILPTKYLQEERSLMWVGAHIIRIISEPKTISRLWNELKTYDSTFKASPITFDWFVLALDFLYILNAIKFEDGRIWRVA